jgi:IS1 family transposase
LAWHNGGRTDGDFRQLLKYLETIPIDLYYSDDWGAYSRNLPENKHFIGKDRTWKILVLRTKYVVKGKRLKAGWDIRYLVSCQCYNVVK